MSQSSPSGLIYEILRQYQMAGIPVRPVLTNNELVVEFTEQEFLEAITRNMDPQTKQYITVRFEPGRMVIRVRLL